MPSEFDLRALKAKEDIDDALGMLPQRLPQMPQPMQQPANIPGNPMLTPQGVQFSGQQQIGPGMLSGAATVSPQGFRGAGVNYSMPAAGGQLNLGAQYQPGAGMSGQVQYARQFQEGGLATSVHNPTDYHDRDIEFINTRNQHMRELVGRQAYAEGGLAGVGDVSDEDLVRMFFADQNNSAVVSEVNRRIGEKLLRRFNGDREAAQAFLRETNNPMAVLTEGYAKGGGVWTRKEGQNPEGGLNAAGRASLRAQGHDIKPPVSAKMAAKSSKAAARRKSFCARMGGMEGPMKDENGKPTRKALALRKWDCKAEGGAVKKPIWDKKRPADLGEPDPLSAKRKKAAKARAKAAGRPYPNLVDNMAVARSKGK